MDVSVASLREAFSDTYCCQFRKGFRIFMFVLIAPSDRHRFRDFVEGFEELHHLTGDDALVIAPRVMERGEPVSRYRVAEMINAVDRNQVYTEFASRQASEVYDFARFIGLPSSDLPALILFDRLDDPEMFAAAKLADDPASSLIRQIRAIFSDLQERCQWRTRQALERHRLNLDTPPHHHDKTLLAMVDELAFRE